MATKKTASDPVQDLKDAFSAFIDNLLANAGSGAAAEADEDEGDEERERLMGLTLTALKKEAVEAGYDAADLKGLTKEDIVDALLSDEEEGDEDDDDESDEDDESDDDDDADEDDDSDDEDEAEDYTREDLEDMTLKELRDVAKEGGATAADVKGLDQDELIDLILGDSEDEDDDEDGDDEDGDEDDSDDDEEELTEDDLNDMSEAELKKLAADMGVKIRKNATKKSIIAALLDAADE
jgi:hypothetical protein